MGGLAARYAIGKLYKPANQEDVKDSVADSSQETPKGTICGLEAMNFITVATPHLGSMGNKQVTLLVYMRSALTLLNRLLNLFETNFLLQLSLHNMVLVSVKKMNKIRKHNLFAILIFATKNLALCLPNFPPG